MKSNATLQIVKKWLLKVNWARRNEQETRRNADKLVDEFFLNSGQEVRVDLDNPEKRRFAFSRTVYSGSC